MLLFSGGQDSATCLAWALDRYARVETVGFDYGQRHHVEMQARLTVRDAFATRFPQWAERLGEDRVLDIASFGRVAESALTADRAIEADARGLPTTFVPGRNLVFFVYAAALADRRGAHALVGGMCETDFSGYPDCRPRHAGRHGAGAAAGHGAPLPHRDAADAAHQGRDLGAGAPARRRRPGGADPDGDAHLLPRRPNAPPLGRRLRRLPRLRAARPRMGRLAARGRASVTYAAKELFLTLQGEGGQAGRAAVFLRFAGCNLWSGREQDRAAAACTFCDTDFVGVDGPGGGRFASPDALADAAAALWRGEGSRLVVCTGGEPLLQLDPPLIVALHARGFEVAVETNGTLPAPPGLDWICVSPKGAQPVVQTTGHELKLVFPQAEAPPERFAALAFERLLLQPMDGPERERNTRAAIAYCLTHPRWRLSVQTHKMLGIP